MTPFNWHFKPRGQLRVDLSKVVANGGITPFLAHIPNGFSPYKLPCFGLPMPPQSPPHAPQPAAPFGPIWPSNRHAHWLNIGVDRQRIPYSSLH